MSDWQAEGMPQTPEPLRTRWAVMLVQALDQIEEKYILGTIDRAEYEAQLQDLDGKLSIVGLALASKPWAKNANRL